MADTIKNPSVAGGTDSEHKKNKNTKGQIKKIAAGAIIVLAAAYFAGVAYYRGHFYGNTYINGKKLSNATVAEAEAAFTGDLSSHTITLKGKSSDTSQTIDPASIDTVIAVGDQIKNLKESFSPWKWVGNFLGKKDHSISLDVTYNEDKLQSVIDGLYWFQEENDIQAPVNASIEAGETAFEIVPETLGNTVKKEELTEAVKDALSHSQTEIDLEKSDLYKLPEYYASDEVVKKALETANKYTSGKITYDFSYTTKDLTYKTTHRWIKISDDFKVTLRKSKIEEYVTKLAEKYNSMGGAHKFTTAYGKETSVAGGDYGYKIYHDKEVETLIKNLKAGETLTREPEYSYTGYKDATRTSRTDDIGDSYVEVSISSQELWLYVNGECKVNSSVVTGSKSQHHDTDKGVYSITYKQSPATLTGPNAGGGSYSSKVTYWMPFNGNQGLHDATWRNSFGGSEYVNNGSHGCVNCPYSTAKILYKYVEEGFPVVIY